MAFNVNDKAAKSSGPRQLPKPGVQMARILQVVDLGVQERPLFKGEQKPPVRQVLFTFELPNDKMELNGEKVPLRISTKAFTLSTDTKSSLFKFMNSVDPSNAFGGDLAKYLNLPVMLTIVHSSYQKDGQEVQVANINGVMPVPEGMPVPELNDPAILFDYDNPTVESYKGLPVWLRQKLRKAKNFEGSKLVPISEEVPDEAPQKEETPAAKAEEAPKGKKGGKSPY